MLGPFKNHWLGIHSHSISTLRLQSPLPVSGSAKKTQTFPRPLLKPPIISSIAGGNPLPVVRITSTE